MRKESKKFLESYLNNASPTGFESSGQKLWLDYIKPYIDDSFSDVYGNTVGIVNPTADYKVVIEAHADEISWFVNYISEKGLIYVIRNGGSDHQIAPSMRVNIHGDNGIVKGIFGWPAIHVRKSDKEEAPSLKNIIVDVGAASKEEVEEMGIHVGTVITYQDEMMILNNKFITGRALDNRIGGFMIAETLRMIKESKKKLDFGLYVVNSVQEEIGLRGAEMISRRIKPNVAIITDVCHDTQTPMYDMKEQGDQACGKGPVLTYGPAVQNNLLNMIIDVAKKKNIPFQRAATSRSTGTDTDAFAYSGEGVASALISLPLKYMHTTVETVNIEDMENVIKLMYEFVVQLKKGHDFSYLKK
jgi:putative aminopeptidase FrvX